MTLRISAIFLLPSLFIGPTLRAQSVFHDSHAPQVSFASAEICRALGPYRATPDRGMRDLSTGKVRFGLQLRSARANRKPLLVIPLCVHVRNTQLKTTAA